MADKNLKPGWKVWRFDQMVTNVNVRIDNPSESGMEHYVGLEHLDPDSLRIRRWGSPGDVEATKLCFKKGDIIFGRRRAYQRKLGVAEFDGICSAHAMVVRAKPDVVLPEFLPFFMQSDLFMNRAVEISVGSLSPTINWKTMAVQEFALPPIEEQRRCSELLLSIQACREMLDEAHVESEALVSSLCNAFIDKNANLIELRALIFDGPQNGLYVPSTKYGKGTPILRIDAFYDGKLVSIQSLKRIDIEQDTVDKYVLRENDLVVNRVNSREFVGKAARVMGLTEKTVFESNMMRFSVRPDLVEAEFVNVFLNAPSVRRQVLARCKDAINQSSINQEDVYSLKIPKADLETQRILLRQLAELRAATSEITGRLAQAKGFTGRIFQRFSETYEWQQ